MRWMFVHFFGNHCFLNDCLTFCLSSFVLSCHLLTNSCDIFYSVNVRIKQCGAGTLVYLNIFRRISLVYHYEDWRLRTDAKESLFLLVSWYNLVYQQRITGFPCFLDSSVIFPFILLDLEDPGKWVLSWNQACRGYEISHPYLQNFRGYPWIYPYPQAPIFRTYNLKFLRNTAVKERPPSTPKTQRRHFPLRIVNEYVKNKNTFALKYDLTEVGAYFPAFVKIHIFIALFLADR